MSIKSEYIWYNGKIIKLQDATINILTHGLHYGIGAYEGIRIYNGKPFMLERHIARLYESAKVCDLTIEFSEPQIIDATCSVIEKNKLVSGYARPIIWSESDSLILYSGTEKSNIAVAAWQSFEGSRKSLRESGLQLTISSWRKPPSNSIPHNSKNTGLYMLNYLAKKEAVKNGFNDALMLDQNECVAEATTSNFFLIKGDTLVTPKMGDFLSGITREVIIDLAHQLGLEVIEDSIELDQLDADAAFLSGTASEMLPISSINTAGKNYKYSIHNINYQKLVGAFDSLTKN